jgi:Pectate lyase superfamily protein
MTTYNTGNALGSTDARDLYDNAQTFDQLTNGTDASYVDRLGVSRRSLAGIEAAADGVLDSIGYSVPVAYAAGISMTLTSQTVEYAGVVYAPKSSALPFTTSGTFETAKFRAIQVTDADLITYTPAGTGAVPTTVREKLREFVSVFDFMTDAQKSAVKAGTSTDDTAAITAAITAAVDVYFPAGTYKCGAIMLPARNVNLFSDGATIQGTSGTFVFKQRKRGYLTSLSDLIFTGNATAFDYDSDDASLPNGSQYYEYKIESCRFLQAAAVHAIRLYGAREGLISNCYFQDNNGIYTEFAINTVVSNCQFKNCGYMVLSKLGSEGLIVSNAVALGCSFGLRCERTTGVQLINSMIDYCDAPVYLQGATDVLISNNYISTRTGNPALHAVKYPDGFRGYNHIIKGNNIVDNYSTTGSACVRYEETDFFNIVDNVLANYASYGIVYASCVQGDISRNIVRNRNALGTNSILSLTDSDTIRIYQNRLVQALSRTNNTSTWENTGFTTEASGEAIITTGNSSVVVNHGLAITPNKVNISLTPTTPNTQGIDYYVSATTASTFTVTTGSPVGSTTAFAWQARSKP